MPKKRGKCAPRGIKWEKMVLTAAGWIMTVLRTTCVGGFLWRCTQKRKKSVKQWHWSLGLGSLYLCSQDQRVLLLITWKKHLRGSRTASVYCCSPSGALCDLTVYSDCSAGLFNANDFSLLIQTQYDLLQELSDAAAETETSLLLSGLVINCHVCLFVMTPGRNLSALSHASLS